MRNDYRTTAERRNILQQHKQALNALRWTESRLKVRLGRTADIDGGLCATAQPGSRSISFIELPSVANNTPIREWEHDDMGIGILNFRMAREYDLILIIELPALE